VNEAASVGLSLGQPRFSPHFSALLSRRNLSAILHKKGELFLIILPLLRGYRNYSQIISCSNTLATGVWNAKLPVGLAIFTGCSIAFAIF